ncbi:MAG: protein kinase family protein [Candidatus Brocadiae bacterium]|nr:protein kinase family protein [Candidatus Brocadiia bacterium]
MLSYRGSGNRGHVFRAQPTALGAERALKFVPENKLVVGWEAEILKASKLEKQPNTVPSYAFFPHGGGEGAGTYAVLVFDFVEGSNLRQWIKSADLAVADVVKILRELLIFRADCISAGVRHGDLHAGNIILHDPVLGPDRAYEVMVTDFGIGFTEGALKPKDDLIQIGDIAARMLMSVEWEKLGPTDRRIYDGLCHGAALKRLREVSRIERGDDEAALVDDVLVEIRDTTSRAYAPISQAPLRRRFPDYLVAEQLGDRWQEWRDLFVPHFPGFEDVVSRNITVLTGTRGCGKTMVFRRLSALLAFEVGPLTDAGATSFVGFYLNMNDVSDAFLLSVPRRPDEGFARRVIQFFHLCLASEIIRVAAVARSKADSSDRNAYDTGNRWLFDFIRTETGAQVLYPGPEGFASVLASEVERAKDEVRGSKSPCARLASLGEADWLRKLIPGIQQAMPWIGQRPIYFFVDDYSLPRVGEAIQRSLNSVIFRRSHSYFFKISTEAPSTLCREDFSGKALVDPHDFELTDLGSVTIDLLDETRERFLDDIFRRRLDREERFRGCSLERVLGRFQKSWAQLAREIRGRGASTDPAASDERRRGRVLYYGREVLVNMWSGDTRDMVRIAQSLLEELPAGDVVSLPIGADAQNKVFQRTGGEFLHLLEACTRTSRSDSGEDDVKIDSWGKHLVKIANAFKAIALHELRTRQGGRKGREGEPKQAFRIEMLDRFSLDGLPGDIYEDLVRYGVFLRDNRGKSIRGAIIPRLYLRRLLVPFFTLTFSKADNIAMDSSYFKTLLLYPDELPKLWRRKRPPPRMKQGDFGW